MPRYEPGSRGGLPFLRTGVRQPERIIAGRYDAFSVALKNSASTSHSTGDPRMRCSAVRPAGSVALPLLSFDIAALTSSGVTQGGVVLSCSMLAILSTSSEMIPACS